MCQNCNHGIIIVIEIENIDGKLVTSEKEYQCPCCGGLWKNCNNCGE